MLPRLDGWLPHYHRRRHHVLDQRPGSLIAHLTLRGQGTSGTDAVLLCVTNSYFGGLWHMGGVGQGDEVEHALRVIHHHHHHQQQNHMNSRGVALERAAAHHHLRHGVELLCQLIQPYPADEGVGVHHEALDRSCHRGQQAAARSAGRHGAHTYPGSAGSYRDSRSTARRPPGGPISDCRPLLSDHSHCHWYVWPSQALPWYRAAVIFAAC
jgi:hypothetical protein